MQGVCVSTPPSVCIDCDSSDIEKVLINLCISSTRILGATFDRIRVCAPEKRLEITTTFSCCIKEILTKLSLNDHSEENSVVRVTNIHLRKAIVFI
jgi:hypothetical protein